MKDVTTSHDDMHVITSVFRRGDNNNAHLHRVLVDTGTSVDILSWNTFKDLGLSQSDLMSNRAQVQGFSQAKVPVEGTITVPVTLGQRA